MSEQLRKALIAHEKKVVDMVLSCQKDPKDVYCTSAEVLESRYALLDNLADSATAEKNVTKVADGVVARRINEAHAVGFQDGVLKERERAATADAPPETTDWTAAHKTVRVGDVPPEVTEEMVEIAMCAMGYRTPGAPYGGFRQKFIKGLRAALAAQKEGK